jgi:hypothetical protein
MIYFEYRSGLHLMKRNSQFTTINCEICFPLCWADTNMILAFETDVLQTGEKNQPVLYNIVSFQDHKYRASLSESCSTLMLLDRVKKASYVYNISLSIVCFVKLCDLPDICIWDWNKILAKGLTVLPN